MHRRQPLPRLWMMTDERQGDELWPALQRLPRGAGIVFRHYGLSPSERRTLFKRVRGIADRKRLVLLLAGAPRLARAWGADGSHGRGPQPREKLLRSASVHSFAELRTAERNGAGFVFLSPVFATRSHPGANPLGRIRASAIAARTRLPVLALGGMDARRARALSGMKFYGWAAIDAWGADQKRKAVPT